MSLGIKIPTWLSLAGMLFITTFTNSSAYAASTLIDGITDPSTPYFLNDFSLSANQGKWRVTGRADFFFDDGTNPTWTVTGNGILYKLNATFDKSGNFVSGDVQIKGGITGLGIPGETLLMSADLIAYAWGGNNTTNPIDNNLVGFNTTNIYCDSGLGVYCTNSESVLLVLTDPFGGDVNAKIQKASGYAITSVPLPAAVWLFLSGLGLMGATARRRRSTS